MMLRSRFCRNCCYRFGLVRVVCWILSFVLATFVVLHQAALRRRPAEPPWKSVTMPQRSDKISTLTSPNLRLHHDSSDTELCVENGIPCRLKQPKVGARIWPSTNETDDRILAQVNLVPFQVSKVKKIVHYDGFTTGNARFIQDKCTVDKCEFISKQKSHIADVVVTNTYDTDFRWQRTPSQIIVWFMLESPLHSAPPIARYVNWTATYRRDSTLPTPYQRFTHYKNFSGVLPPPSRNFSKGKTKLVAWFVTNCLARNGRQNYVAELRKYIRIDVYGGCGTLECPRGSAACEEMLSTDYKFYLSFENSNCVDYITEKFYWNALWNNVVPVVMGARPEDYAAVAPPNSYIHVDDFRSPRDLAKYLLMLNNDHEKYNEYFRWKGTGEFIDTKFWCRLCALAHETERTKKYTFYNDLTNWWKDDGICLAKANGTTWTSWRDEDKKLGIT